MAELQPFIVFHGRHADTESKPNKLIRQEDSISGPDK